MYERQFVVACEGNLSVRLDREQILVTPAGACKGHLAPDDLVITGLSGQVTRGTRRPSSEILMHLLYYRSRPDVFAMLIRRLRRDLQPRAARLRKRFSRK